MKKIYAVSLIILALTFSLFGCSNSKTNIPADDIEETTEAVTEEELSYQEILDKAVEHFGKYVSLDKYSIDKTSFGDQTIYVTNYDLDEAYLSFTVTLGGDLPLTVNSTKTSDLIDYGCMKGNQEKTYQGGDDDPGFFEDVYMLYNEKYFHIGEDRISDQQYFSEMIRYVDLQTDEKAVEFEYCGLTKDSSIEDVVDRFGSPNQSNVIRYNEESDKYTISVGYSDQYHSDEDKSVFVDFNYEYDYKMDSSKLIDLYIHT